MDQKKIGRHFILLGFGCLLVSITFGLVASLQYVIPHLYGEVLSFRTTRPLHVFLAINWIFACVTGVAYNAWPQVAGRPLHSFRLAQIHFFMHLATVVVVIVGFFSGTFSGREYLEFPVWVSGLIVGYWLLFVYNYFKTVHPDLRGAPVYIWSWTAGLVFFLITMTEAHLWLLPWFNNNIIRDVTIQWKANGSMVGAWNMLIYGSSMFIMERVSGNTSATRGRTAFLFFFLGFTNLMFNWGHHTYVVPAHPAVKQVAYIISMTELILFANIIMKWRKNMGSQPPPNAVLTVTFFTIADRWILMNLALAIAISVPYINQFTHGTQITVAHAMGTTIGINTTLLLGCVSWIVEQSVSKASRKHIILASRWLHWSLLVFWCSLLVTGVIRSSGTISSLPFVKITEQMLPWLRVFSLAGVALVAALAAIIISLVRPLLARVNAA